MDPSRATTALYPFTLLAASATSPRAAADLITSATAAPNTYVFAELLAHPNIAALQHHETYASHYSLLQTFAWGTWESYHASPNLPQLNEKQTEKLRLLSLLSIASSTPTTATIATHLSYASLCTQLGLSGPAELEILVTTAIYSELLHATLSPSTSTVVVTSVAPLRDLAPGSVNSMIAELAAWSARCDSVLLDLEAEIEKVKAEATLRGKREARAEKQVKAVMDEKKGSGGGDGILGRGASRAASKRGGGADDDDGDAMDVDGGMGSSGMMSSIMSGMGGAMGGGGGKKRSAGGGGVGGGMAGGGGKRSGR